MTALHVDSVRKAFGDRTILNDVFLSCKEGEIVLLDEPFHNIAPLQIEQIKAIIKAHAANKAVIITDHSYQNVIDISSKIILIEDGNTRQIKELEELFKYGYLPESVRPNPLDEVI
jgi:lipopolysaccharide export system ATP-binding protein